MRESRGTHEAARREVFGANHPLLVTRISRLVRTYKAPLIRFHPSNGHDLRTARLLNGVFIGRLWEYTLAFYFADWFLDRI